MSKVTISGNASGTGTLLIAAPNTNSDITLNLPATMGTNNSNSVVTTDATGNLGLGVTPSAWGGSAKAFQISTAGALYSTGASVGVASNYYFDGTTNKYITSNFASLYYQTSGQHQWFTAPSGTAGNAITFTQAMTLDASGNLLVGTTDTSLYNNGAGGGVGVGLNPDGYVQVARSGSNPLLLNRLDSDGLIADFRINGTVVGGIGGVTGGSIWFGTGASSTERARIDSSGNLGLGVTPSAWDSTWRNIDVFSYGAVSSSPTAFRLTANSFNNGTNWIYKNTAQASYYQQGAGIHSWLTAASGTAGAAITFTQAMTLDANGDLGIGMTSPTVRIEATDTNNTVYASTGATLQPTSGILLTLNNLSGTTGTTALITTNAGGPSHYFGTYREGALSSTGAFVIGQRTGTATYAERMRITSDGYLRMASGSLGIQFNGDTAAANALDDYEQGTFTATIAGSTTAGTATYSVTSAHYTKVGNLVTCNVRLVWSGHTGTGNMRIAGLPFAGVTVTSGYAAVFAENMTVTGQVFCSGVSVGTTLNGLFAVNNGGSTALAMDTAAGIFVVFSYFA